MDSKDGSDSEEVEADEGAKLIQDQHNSSHIPNQEKGNSGAQRDNAEKLSQENEELKQKLKEKVSKNQANARKKRQLSLAVAVLSGVSVTLIILVIVLGILLSQASTTNDWLKR